VKNVTKSVVDWYLARLHVVCDKGFHFVHWELSVDVKPPRVNDLCGMIRIQLSNHRMVVFRS